jgi:hypothetical protein
MNNNISEIFDKIALANDEIIQRHISVYSLFCEGQRYDEIAKIFNISKRTVSNDIKWCKENLPKGFSEEFMNDTIFDTIRRRAILWSRFKKLEKDVTATYHLVSISKHILELDKKIIEWKNIIKHKSNDIIGIDPSDVDSILKALDNHIKDKTDEELKEIIKNHS